MLDARHYFESVDCVVHGEHWVRLMGNQSGIVSDPSENRVGLSHRDDVASGQRTVDFEQDVEERSQVLRSGLIHKSKCIVNENYYNK